MPFYEYRPKAGDCGICGGCFVDLQKMSDPHHKDCPDCGQACERVLSAPIVSVRGAEYRAAANKENRAVNLARATGENAKLRDSTLKKYGRVEGHTHNCALSGCFGETVRSEARAETPADANSAGNSADAETQKAHRFGGLPHLVGVGKK